MSGTTGNVILPAADDGSSEQRRDVQYQVNLRPWVSEVLTTGECTLLEHLLTGKSLTVIAAAKGRDIRTMSTHKINLYRKLGITSDLTLYKNLLEQNAIMLMPY